jgi:hypothetical protein
MMEYVGPSSPMGFLANSVDRNVSQGAMMQPMEQTAESSGHVHYVAAGIVIAAIVVIASMYLLGWSGEIQLMF